MGVEVVVFLPCLLGHQLHPSLNMLSIRIVVVALTAVTTAVGVASPEYDCDSTSCPSKCYCAFQNCQDVINTCFQVDTCMAAQDCANACECDGNSCLRRCATYFPWPEVSAVYACINYNCPQSGTATPVDQLLG